MLHKFSISDKYGNEHIAILYPGNITNSSDSGLGAIGRIDQAKISHKTVIKMHPHSNDEILSYFRKGNVMHKDSAGISKQLNSTTLMLMKAGTVFYHEEEIQDYLEGLQLFFRPREENAKPEVTFATLDKEFSTNTWRLIASPNNDSYLQLTTNTWLYDTLLEENKLLSIPHNEKATVKLLYVFQGEIMANDIKLTKGESLLIRDEKVLVKTETSAELVLFETNENDSCYVNGMFSGNKR
jgi:quercetin 2,3-dioxygenase